MDYKPQSGQTDDAVISRVMGDHRYQATMFSDQNPEYQYSMKSATDVTRTLQDTSDASLANFFSRPIKIVTYDWGTGLTLANDINPWQAYFENPRVANRLTNFNLLRAKLHVKIVINGNSFQYGRALVNYLPLDTLDFLSSNAALVPNDLIQASQQPHIFLNPTLSTGGELELPFFWHKNYLRIPNNDWRDMGRLFFRSLTTLKHANGASDRCVISVFAWATDVHLSVLTSLEQSSLSPQSGAEVDEAAMNGMISGPATAIAKFARAASAIPGIAPFAISTDIAATATAAIAKQFGYSRPAMVNDPAPMNPKTISNMALTNVPDGAQKLTVDAKQELTIDPRISGLGEGDGMCIKEIAKRESYLTSFTWQIAANTETLLWNTRVSPVLWASTTTASDPAIHLPACAYAALPFDYWTGTMRFRFQICSSGFHKGRLKFVYDPNYLASNEYNTNYIDIIDLADKTDFTLEIGMGQNTTILPHRYPGRDAVSTVYGTTLFNTYDDACNGVLGVYVVNSLSTPNSTVNNDVTVNVFVSAGDDFEVFVPNEEIGYYTFKPQSGPEREFLLDSYPVVTVVEDEELVDFSSVTKSWMDCFKDDYTQCFEFKWLEMFDECPFCCWRHHDTFDDDSFTPQSGMEAIVPDAQNTDEVDAPQQAEAHQLGLLTQETSKINLVFTGESIQSFRTMLKRYNLFRTVGLYTSVYTVTTGRFSAYPFLRGNVTGAIDLTATSTPYSYVNTVMLHYVTAAFSGWRGSIRWKFIKLGGQANSMNDTMWIERRGKFAGASVIQSSGLDWSAANAKTAARNSIVINPRGLNTAGPPYGMTGMTVAHSLVNPNIEFEMPFYNDFRFIPGKPVDYTTSPNMETFEWSWVSQGGPSSVGSFYCAAGEDFQTYFFTGCPRLYYVAGGTPA